MRCEPASCPSSGQLFSQLLISTVPRLGRIFRPSHRRWRMARVARTAAQMWLYPMVEYQRSLLTPFSMWAAGAANALVDPCGPLAYASGAPCFAAGHGTLSTRCQTGPQARVPNMED